MRYAYVTTNLLDLWDRPKFNSERVSQLLFGEVVTVSSVRTGYARVCRIDGYTGWALDSHLKSVSKSRAFEYVRNINRVVANEKAVLYRPSSGDPQPHFLYYGTRLRAASARNGFVRCQLPDGETILVKPQRIRPISVNKAPDVRPARIVAEAAKFLGVPYLWGGISPAGFDCSGFVRAVFGRFGVYLPRDTKDQVQCGTAIERENVRTGDLLFFKRHVGLALSGERIIHASVAGSGVRINSLRPEGDNYRPDLDKGFVTARRILC